MTSKRFQHSPTMTHGAREIIGAVLVFLPLILAFPSTAGGLSAQEAGAEQTARPEPASEIPEDLDRQLFFTRGDSAMAIPVRLANRHIYVQVEVNGVPGLLFILDTGASASLLSSRTVEQLGLKTFGKLEIIGRGGRGEASYTAVDSLGLPGLLLRNQRLLVWDLEQLRPFLGIRVDGILGYDFIRRVVLRLDYQHRTICLHHPDAFSYEGSGEYLPLTLEGKVPLVQGVVDGTHQGTFLLDTGASQALALNWDFVDQNRLLRGRKHKREIYTGGVGGVVRHISARLDSFSLGSYRFPLVPAVFGVEDGAEIGGRHRLDGIIGGALLDHFTLYFDYGRRYVILETNNVTGQPVILDCSGLQLYQDGDQLVVAGVAAKSPGDQAGIRVEDRILTLDGQSAPALGLPEIRERLRLCDGTRVRLGLLRKGKEKVVTLRLKPYH